MITTTPGLRGTLTSYIPNWLSNRLGKNAGFRFLWVIAFVCDVFVQAALEGLRSAWPGNGTPTALAYIGLSRGIVRGYGTSETDDHYAQRLRAWFATWKLAGSQLGIGTQVHEYLANRPLVRVVNRLGRWTTINSVGVVSTITKPWIWDSVSNPERANFWSDEWVIVYPYTWANSGNFGAFGNLGQQIGIGHAVSREEYTTLKQILNQWKSAHSNIRAVIFTTDATLFDPSSPASLPDGQWGQWGDEQAGNGSRVASHRNISTCRYWEPGLQ